MKPFLKYTCIIILILVHINANSQFARTRIFSEPTFFSLCGGSIVFDSLGYFFREHGCENDSYVSLGRYKIFDGNKIELNYISFDSVPLFKKIVYVQDSKDSSNRIRFFDRFNQQLTFVNLEYATDSLKKTERIRLNKNNEFIVSSKSEGWISFSNFWLLYENLNKTGRLFIPVQNKSLDIYLNLPSSYFYSNLHPDTLKNESMLFKNRGLYSLDGKEKFFYQRD